MLLVLEMIDTVQGGCCSNLYNRDNLLLLLFRNNNFETVEYARNGRWMHTRRTHILLHTIVITTLHTLLVCYFYMLCSININIL